MHACSAEWNERVSAYLDGEIDAVEHARVEAHLASCDACHAVHRAFGRIGSTLRVEASESVPANAVARARSLVPPSTRGWRRLAYGVAAAVAVAGSGAVAWSAMRPPMAGLSAPLAVDALTQHLKGFASTRPCEFESSDPRAVEGWVRERLGYDVVIDVVPGAELVGARRCRIGGQPAAAIVYRSDAGGVTVFVPSPFDESVSSIAEGPRCASTELGQVCAQRDGERTRIVAASFPGDRLLAFLAPQD